MNLNKKQLVKIALIAIPAIVLVAAGVLYWTSKDTPSAQASWWNDNWSYRKAIVINHAQVAGELTDFPVLVSLTDASLSGHAQEDGDDFKFILHGTNKVLSHEIEKYASSTGELVAWVKIPSLSATDDTIIYMYYGNAAAGNQETAESVWDESYVGVWHLPDDENASTTDSTRHNNDGTAIATASSTASGKIDGAFLFDGNSDYISCGDISHIDDATELSGSAWVYHKTVSDDDSIITKNLNGAADGFILMRDDAGQSSGRTDIYKILIADSDDTDNAFIESASGTSAMINTWNYVTFTFKAGDSNGLRLYINGAEDANSPASTVDIGAIDAGEIAMRIGVNSGNTSFFKGRIDEVRISNTARTAAWIETEYNNQSDPASFFAEQAEEVGPGPVGYWTFDTGYGTTAYDASGQGNDGTITGAEWQDESMCVSGKCLYFDGSGDYVEISDFDY